MRKILFSDKSTFTLDKHKTGNIKCQQNKQAFIDIPIKSLNQGFIVLIPSVINCYIRTICFSFKTMDITE